MSSIPREALNTNASKPGVIGVPSSTLSALARAISSCGSEMSAGVILFTNWRMRSTRAALEALGFKDDILRHGIQREVFLCQFADNAAKLLRTGKGKPDLS